MTSLLHLVDDFEQLKISAISKLPKINCNSIKTITLGPDSVAIVKKPICTTTTENGTETTKQNKTYNSNVAPEFGSNNGIPLRQIIKELDIQRQNKVKCAINAHVNKLKEFTKQQEQARKMKWKMHQQAFARDMDRKEQEILEEMQRYDRKTSTQQAKLVEHYHELALRRQKHEEEVRRKHEEDLLLREKQLQLIEKIQTKQSEFSKEYQALLQLMKTYGSYQDFRDILDNATQEVRRLSVTLDEIIQLCKTCQVSEHDVMTTNDIVHTTQTIVSEVDNYLKAVVEHKQQELLAKEQEEKRVTESANQAPEASASPVVPVSESIVEITKFVSVNNLKTYSELMEILDMHTNSFRDLLEDSSLKQFKFDCKKAINIPVNAISPVNTQHLLDKYQRLFKLLSGQPVNINDKQVSAALHPQGVAFCMDLLAKKFVLQGDLMISSNPEAAFCYATVINSLWNDFPLFGKLLVAYFYKMCPYLVPYYMSRNVDETDEDFYVKLGYQYHNGEVEKQDKFLKRMTGIMRLFAALMITKPKMGQSKIPFNIQQAWRWLGSVLKLEPQVDITATMLHTFLETVGFEMEAKYGKQFFKLRMLLQNFLPVCKEKCTGGAGTRLELLLRNGRFEIPSGYSPRPIF